VMLSVKLSEPVYCYVLCYGADGTEQLLWPCDEQGEARPEVTPPQLAKLPQLPLGGNDYRLDEEPAGGLQVFAVAASRQPLATYNEWCRQRRKPITWKRQIGFTGVWQADANGTYPVVKGQSERSVKPVVGVPPLSRLCQELKSGGVEAVEAIAFSVTPKNAKK